MQTDSNLKTILLATRNSKKQKELQDLLDGSKWKVLSMRDFPDCPDVEEDGETFLENAEKKAHAVSNYSGLITLADDSGLEVDALNKAPGVRSARYSNGDHSTDEGNIVRVLEELKMVPRIQRTARFVCAIVIAHRGDLLFTTQKTVEGIITDRPIGTNGFGYDPIFYYPPFGKTFAESAAEEKHAVSHRGKALREVTIFLKDFSPQNRTENC